MPPVLSFVLAARRSRQVRMVDSTCSRNACAAGVGCTPARQTSEKGSACRGLSGRIARRSPWELLGHLFPDDLEGRSRADHHLELGGSAQ
jgi:hypothetical protein